MKKHTHRLRTVAIVVAAVLLLGLGTVHAIVQYRLEQARAGVGAVSAPSMPVAIEGTTNADGRIEAHADYTSIAADDGAVVHSDFTWDDDWFFADPTVYNNDLARACSVLSAVAISESEYYQRGSTSPAYMENLLAQLGFEEISSASYRYRSEVLDEIANAFTPSGTDVTAYSIASKHITDSETGEKKLLLVVSVRGSYGTEWLSNLRMGFSGGLAEGLDTGKGDHEGFSAAAEEVADAVLQHISDLEDETGEEIDLSNVALLVTGHSRGAATANLAAAYLDNISNEWTGDPDAGDEYSGWYLHASNIYAYALATPEVSSNENCRDAGYDNIFNILNPSDIVPRVPLEAWGFERYGRDLWLPEPGCDGFDEKYEQFKAAFEQDMGCASKYDPADAASVDAIVSKISSQSPTIDDFMTPLGIVRGMGAMVMGHDPVRILQGHAPNTYIAWLTVIDPSDLRTSR